MFYRSPIHIAPTSVIFRRPASTHTINLQNILKKKPEDVVITFAKRTAMGKAKKGQFININSSVDQIMSALFKVIYCSVFCVAHLMNVCPGYHFGGRFRYSENR